MDLIELKLVVGSTRPERGTAVFLEQPVEAVTDMALTILLDDLAWWGEALRRARAAGELPPANERRAA